jgi:hypothetical protein
MVFTRNPAKGGTSGPAMAGNSIAFTTTWRKVKLSKIDKWPMGRLILFENRGPFP